MIEMIENQIEAIYNELPENGDFRGNNEIMKRIGLSRSEFYVARDARINEGRFRKGMGRGGKTGRSLSFSATLTSQSQKLRRR